MCELFGYCSCNEEPLNDYLKTFYYHCEEHPHGWGLAILDPGEYALVKEPLKARNSLTLKNILSSPITGRNVFAHIRLATIGDLKTSNCHPFAKKDNAGRTWTLIHNGTVFDFPELCKYANMECGETDSEKVLLSIINKVNDFERDKGELSTLEERFNLINYLMEFMAYNNKLNLLIFDGEQMYVHINRQCALHYLKKDEGVIFSTKALTDDDKWRTFPLNVLMSFKDGKLLYKGKSHNHEYIATEEQLRFINQFADSLKDESFGEYVW